MNQSTAIFLTYSHRPHFDEQDYEGFLREHDNPFFNGIDGIARYENWKLLEPYPSHLGFDYFDLIYLDGSRPLRDVWFDQELTVFRRNWVARWGYGSSPPPVVNGQGYAMTGCEIPPVAERDADVFLAFSAQGAPRPGEWTIEAAMPKHYAFAEDQQPEVWYQADFDARVLPGRRVGLCDVGPSDNAFRARRIAP